MYFLNWKRVALRAFRDAQSQGHLSNRTGADCLKLNYLIQVIDYVYVKAKKEFTEKSRGLWKKFIDEHGMTRVRKRVEELIQ